MSRYDTTDEPPPGGGDFLKRYLPFRESTNLAGLAIDPDGIFGDVRDPSPGRGNTFGDETSAQAFPASHTITHRDLRRDQ